MLHQTVCCFVLSNPSRLCIMGSQWSFFRWRLTPHLQTYRQADRPAAPLQSSPPLPLLCFTHNICIHQETLTFLLVQPSNYDCLLIWRLDKMQMKRDPLNGLLFCLVRLCEEVSPAPWTEPCLFWTCITHVTASLHTDPPPPTHFLPLTPASLPSLLLLVFTI